MILEYCSDSSSSYIWCTNVYHCSKSRPTAVKLLSTPGVKVTGRQLSSDVSDLRLPVWRNPKSVIKNFTERFSFQKAKLGGFWRTRYFHFYQIPTQIGQSFLLSHSTPSETRQTLRIYIMILYHDIIYILTNFTLFPY